MNGIAEQFKSLLESTADRLGVELKAQGVDVRDYAKKRMLFLASILGEPGFDLALLAERDNVALKAGIAATSAADAADVELRGVILGALSIGARAIVAAV
jgi:hypothetical protein